MYLYPQKNVMKKIIIIGATSGIGREIAIQYARQGHKVGIAAGQLTLRVIASRGVFVQIQAAVEHTGAVFQGRVSRC